MNKNKKRMAKGIAAAALIGVIAVGSTLAYLSATTDTKTNKFTGGKNLTGHITEDNWKYGDDGWTDYYPGQAASKDPVVHIDGTAGDTVPAIVAMKVECVGNDEQPMSLDVFMEKYATVSYNGADGINPHWLKDTGITDPNANFYYYYQDVAPNNATEAIFDKVTINTGIYRVYKTESAEQTIITYDVDEDGNKIEESKVETKGEVLVKETSKVYIKNADGSEIEVTNDTKLPSFNINVTGYAIQANDEMKENDLYKTELRKMAEIS